MKNQAYYEQLFEAYPDVVTFAEFKTMLGGIGDTTDENFCMETM